MKAEREAAALNPLDLLLGGGAKKKGSTQQKDKQLGDNCKEKSQEKPKEEDEEAAGEEAPRQPHLSAKERLLQVVLLSLPQSAVLTTIP